jgi:CubicO group peptidase (beta-lactamase class C family)
MVNRQRIWNVVFGASLLIFSQAPVAITLDSSQRSRIDAVFEDFDSSTPGCALGIMSDGAMIYSRGYGMATLEPPVANDPTKVFDIASLSKQFVAGSVVLLAQQGRLSLTDDVRKFLPELPDYGSRITVNNLLWHTSGLRDYTVLQLLGGFDHFEVTTQAQALDFIKRQARLNSPPGTRYEYTNSGYVLLAIIAERVSGKTLNQLAREQFFDPLSMPLSVYRDRFDLEIPNQALGHAPIDIGEYVVNISNWEQIGDGGLQTSINEFQRWDENFFTGDVGGGNFIAEMYRTGRLNDGSALIYARGLQRDRYRGLNRVRHGGDWIGYHSNMLRFPDLHTTVALFCNTEGIDDQPIDQYALSTDVADIALEDYFPEPKPTEPGPAPSLPIQRFVGTYFNADLKEVYSVTSDGASLTLTWLFQPLPLISTGPTTFAIDQLPGSQVEFQIQAGRPAHAIAFSIVGDEPDEDPRAGSRFTPVAPPADLNQYTGTFFSRELGVTWNFIVDGGALRVLEDAEQIVLPITDPVAAANAPDAFFGGPGLLQFTRDASGTVTGLKVSFLGMKDFQFERRASASGVPMPEPAVRSDGTSQRRSVPISSAHRLMIRR